MDRIKGWISERPSSDLAAAALVAIALAYFDQVKLLRILEHDQRTLIYATVLGVSSTLLGLVAAALAVVKAVGNGPRVRKLRELHGKTVTSTMQAAMRGLGYAGLLALWCLLADASSRPSDVNLGLAYASMVIGVLRLARAVWVMGLILHIDDADATAPPEQATKKITRRKQPTAA